MTCNSRRGVGHVVAFDLVRAACRVANRLSAERHNAGVRARLSGFFSDYLVSEIEQADLVEREKLRVTLPPKEKPFSRSRADYSPRRYSVLSTGFEYHGVGNSLDAPEYFAAGGMVFCRGVGPFPISAERGI